MKAVFNLARLIVVLFSLFFLVMGMQWLFAPDQLISNFGLSPDGLLGRATIRADMGAMFLVTGLATAMAASNRPQANAFLLCGCLLMGTAACGRLIGFVMDGIPTDGITPLIFELTVIASLVALAAIRARMVKARQTQ